MELLDHDFLLFTDAESGEDAVLCLRAEGGYALHGRIGAHEWDLTAIPLVLAGPLAELTDAQARKPGPAPARRPDGSSVHQPAAEDAMNPAGTTTPRGSIDLYWLPLGAGGHVVRWNGCLYEAVVARRDRRPPRALFHSALEVVSDAFRYVVEVAPVWSNAASERGVVVEGAVGSRWLGRSRAFRYEVRCWRGGRIPDLTEAVDSPRRLSESQERAEALLRCVPRVPPLTWGRDEMGTGDMWNCNSVVAWLLARSGHRTDDIHPPAGGRAPGWRAGLVLAARAEAGARS